MAKRINPLAASVQSKNGRLYAVMQVKQNGKTKPVWRALGLSEDTPKSHVNKVFRTVVRKYEEEYAAMLERADRPPPTFLSSITSVRISKKRSRICKRTRWQVTVL